MLQLSGVSHVYANGTRALDDVNLVVPDGMFGLLGPNGAGKSTLMRTVATLQTPTAGRIKFGDIDVIAQLEKLRETLADGRRIPLSVFHHPDHGWNAARMISAMQYGIHPASRSAHSRANGPAAKAARSIV
jgi:ABC-type methionine transport system ATPase subunit